MQNNGAPYRTATPLSERTVLILTVWSPVRISCLLIQGQGSLHGNAVCHAASHLVTAAGAKSTDSGDSSQSQHWDTDTCSVASSMLSTYSHFVPALNNGVSGGGVPADCIIVNPHLSVSGAFWSYRWKDSQPAVKLTRGWTEKAIQ